MANKIDGEDYFYLKMSYFSMKKSINSDKKLNSFIQEQDNADSYSFKKFHRNQLKTYHVQ